MYAFSTFTKDDHKLLADKLQNIKGRFILSYYNFEGLEEWFPQDKFHWEKKNYILFAAMAKNGTGRNKKKEELLIMNFEPKSNQKFKKLF